MESFGIYGGQHGVVVVCRVGGYPKPLTMARLPNEDLTTSEQMHEENRPEE
jgi:hypothetical protein